MAYAGWITSLLDNHAMYCNGSVTTLRWSEQSRISWCSGLSRTIKRSVWNESTSCRLLVVWCVMALQVDLDPLYLCTVAKVSIIWLSFNRSIEIWCPSLKSATVSWIYYINYAALPWTVFTIVLYILVHLNCTIKKQRLKSISHLYLWRGPESQQSTWGGLRLFATRTGYGFHLRYSFIHTLSTLVYTASRPMFCINMKHDLLKIIPYLIRPFRFSLNWDMVDKKISTLRCLM
jgi:hypothetical protein